MIILIYLIKSYKLKNKQYKIKNNNYKYYNNKIINILKIYHNYKYK